ncbi:hypothetical protein M407DRAFT_21385 [Tulasnella calospora MUT 4182]|uniref:Uncharacterized protein n=1 Tax=Tulasnella calospora MUT 4182 TaxID=1051891 RepID=A0A0C3QN93_9AGAM|nr:hypothetical protein M407DRAFT_21385 [Tulasnella calospora MUT 4182]
MASRLLLDHAIGRFNCGTLQQELQLESHSIFKGHGDWISSIAFSADGTITASGCLDGTVRLWDPATRAPIGDPRDQDDPPVRDIAFSPDAKILASKSDPKRIQLWNAKTGTCIGEPFRKHDAEVK